MEKCKVFRKGRGSEVGSKGKRGGGGETERERECLSRFFGRFKSKERRKRRKERERQK